MVKAVESMILRMYEARGCESRIWQLIHTQLAERRWTQR
jgi:hypothetical protein